MIIESPYYLKLGNIIGEITQIHVNESILQIKYSRDFLAQIRTYYFFPPLLTSVCRRTIRSGLQCRNISCESPRSPLFRRCLDRY